MTDWQKSCFSISVALCAFFTLCACGSTIESQAEAIALQIDNLRYTGYADMQTVAMRYKTVHDSLLSLSPENAETLKKLIPERVCGDSAVMAAAILVGEPVDVASIIGGKCHELAKSGLTNDSCRARIEAVIELARFMYRQSETESSINDLEREIDLYFSRLSPKEQAEIYTSFSTPEILAVRLSAEPNKTEADAIASEVRKIYADNPDILKIFDKNYSN